MYSTTCKIDSQWKFAIWLRELKPVLCDNLAGWGGMGGGREGTYVYLWLIHFDVWPKQHGKAIILQLKTNTFIENKGASEKAPVCLGSTSIMPTYLTLPNQSQGGRRSTIIRGHMFLWISRSPCKAKGIVASSSLHFPFTSCNRTANGSWVHGLPEIETTCPTLSDRIQASLEVIWEK